MSAPGAAAGEPRQVALGLAAEAGRVLLLLRPREPYAGLWSLPGGKRERGEGLAAACRRELVEELGCVPSVAGLRLLVDQTLRAASGQVLGRWLLAIFAFALPAGCALPVGVRWFPLEALDALALIPTDRWFITEALRSGPHAAFRRVEAQLDTAGRPWVSGGG